MEPWIDQMRILASFDSAHRQAERDIIALEPAFHQIRDRLSPEEQDALDLYISACEEFNYTYIRAAYQLGYRNGAAKSE